MIDSGTSQEARRQLLEKLRRGEVRVLNGTRPQPIPRLQGEQGPLSPGQEQIWFHSQLATRAPAYNESVTIHKRGPLDPAILRRCFEEIARRHEIWRSAFPMIDGQAIQRVHPNLRLDLPFVDLSHLSPGAREQESVRIATEDVRRPFDLNDAPLFRIRLVKWADDYHRIYLTVHHLVFDGVSIYRVMIAELAALYQAYSHGQPSPLAELPLQYRDYASWKQQNLDTATHAAQMKYWREDLAGLPSLELPTDRPRPAGPTYGGGMETTSIPASVVAAIKDLARKEGITPYMLLLAVFQVLLYRYSGQDDIVVGGATNTRTRPELEPLIGYFLNPVVFRTRVDSELSFRQFLGSVRRVVVDALAHSDIPFAAIVRELAPKRDPGRHPLFQVLFSMRPPFKDFPDGWDVTDMEAHSGVTGFDLFVEFSEHPDAFDGRFVYSTELFDNATILRFQRHFHELLRQLLANPDQAVSRVPFLTAEERHMLIVEWNKTAKTFPKQHIHELFEAQAEANPDRCALVFRDQKITYAELNARSNMIAHWLRESGAANGSLIGVCMERSFEMVLALLGILKAGCAYVPYDPELPAARINMMLEDSQPFCVITHATVRQALADCAVKLLVLDSICAAIADQRTSNPLLRVESSDAIYAIYTSGSTGVPKAAVNTHAAVANRILWMQDRYQLQPGDRVLQKTPFSFDVSVWEFFWPIVCGATLVIAEPGGHRDPAYLAGIIAAERITTIHFVPSMLREFLELSNLQRCRSLQRVFSSGEALPADLRRNFYLRCGASGVFAQLHNLYGPTEAAVDVTAWDCSPEPSGATVPIGRPIANVAAYILDQHLAPVPVGVAGELYIGGIAVARGYLNRPELTRERFIPDPFDRSPDARLYKTGDRARFLADGNIEYLGRIDNQVKLRGFRIELGEIESTILSHPGVRGALVELRHHRDGDGYLIGYVLPTGSGFDVQDLKAFLRKRLPGYMVPPRFVLLESLPLLSNGKLNRRGLPESQDSEDTPRPARVAASNAVEEQLVAIWETLLNHRPIGVRDNFFDLGGHSLLLMRLVSRIQETFGKKIQLATVFSAPTIEELAGVISGREESVATCRVIPLKPEGTRTPFICLGAGPFFMSLAALLGPDQPFYGLDLTPLNETKLPTPCRLEDLARYAVEAILDFQPEGPYCLGGWCLYGLLAYEVAHQLTVRGQQVELLTLFDTRNTAYARNLPFVKRLEKMAEKCRFHLSNLARANPSAFVRYSMDRLKLQVAKIRGRQQRLAMVRGLENPETRLIDLDADVDAIVFCAAEAYTPPTYAGRVVMLQGTDTPAGRHWQMAVQWRGKLVGDWNVHCLQGGHVTMFKLPFVETLAAKLRADFEQARAAPRIPAQKQQPHRLSSVSGAGS